MIGELQAEGLISSAQAANLEVALQSARTIGAAIGIVMASCHLSDIAAFEVLTKESMDTNRKLRLVAEETVLTGRAPGAASLTRLWGRPPPGRGRVRRGQLRQRPRRRRRRRAHDQGGATLRARA